MESKSPSKAIRDYFGKDGKVVSLAELKALTPSERDELAALIAREEGVEIIHSPK